MSAVDFEIKVTIIEDGKTKTDVYNYVALVGQFPEMLHVLIVVGSPGFKKLTLEVDETIATFERVEWLSGPLPGVNDEQGV